VAGARGKAGETFEHAGDIVVGEAVVAVTALFLRLDQPAGLEFCQMRARSFGVMPASCASSLAVSARPFISAVSMLARAGSPTSEATMAMSGPDFMLRW